MGMPKVGCCDVKSCAYNNENNCNAMAINVGGPEGPSCDTMVKSSIKCGYDGAVGRVGACSVINCQFNDCLLCAIRVIEVRLKDGRPQCDTFKGR